VPLEVVFKGVWPFFLAQLICLMFCLLVPQFVLFLPNVLTEWREIPGRARGNMSADRGRFTAFEGGAGKSAHRHASRALKSGQKGMSCQTGIPCIRIS
jgi:hypothetical protein